MRGLAPGMVLVSKDTGHRLVVIEPPGGRSAGVQNTVWAKYLDIDLGPFWNTTEGWLHYHTVEEAVSAD